MAWWNIVLGPVLDIVGKAVDKVVPDANLREQLKATLTQDLVKAEIEMAKIEAQMLETVNATMREEAKSQHWAQWLWRPTIGFTFAGILVNNYILLPYAQKWIQPLPIPADVWTAILVILGAASAGRSFEKWNQTRNK